MKQISVCLLAFLLAACAGNPPAWWNPNNRYGSVEQNEAQRTVVPQTPVVMEESLDPLPDRSYEEEVITPLPDEENENDTGSSSAQNDEDELPQPRVLSAA